jgi:hypothetical protein
VSAILTPPQLQPGGVEHCVTRYLPDGSRIDFETAPAGWLTRDGNVRRTDHRAYYFTGQPNCPKCDGKGRVPSKKVEGNTVKCQPCSGSGICKRERLVSVTTLLDAISPKGGLPIWAEARGIEGAVTAMQSGLMDADLPPAEAVAEVRRLHLGADRARDDAQDRGLNVHALLEQYMLTGNAPEAPTILSHMGYYQALCRWLLRVNPEPIDDHGTGVEELVASPKDGYAGRRDLRAKCGPWLIGFDAKTQEKGAIFPQAHLQVKLYERGGIACGDEPCDQLKVVVFAANGEYREMDCLASDASIDAALTYYRATRPIEAACNRMNEIEKKARLL